MSVLLQITLLQSSSPVSSYFYLCLTSLDWTEEMNWRRFPHQRRWNFRAHLPILFDPLLFIYLFLLTIYNISDLCVLAVIFQLTCFCYCNDHTAFSTMPSYFFTTAWKQKFENWNGVYVEHHLAKPGKLVSFVFWRN